jgi:hypothetical protein
MSNETSEREAIAKVLARADNYLGDDFTEPWHYLADALLAAGYRLDPAPVIVTTVEGLEALPIGAVVRHWYDEVIEFDDGRWERGAIAEKRLDLAGVPAWFLVGGALGYRSHQVDLLPAIVLHEHPPVAASEVEDDEQFYARCFAGVDSDEHHGKCVVTGHAEDGESAAPEPDAETVFTPEQILDAEDALHADACTDDECEGGCGFSGHREVAIVIAALAQGGNS